MLETYDLPSVRQFKDVLTDQFRRCDNGEGMECSTLHNRIGHYLALCEKVEASRVAAK